MILKLILTVCQNLCNWKIAFQLLLTVEWRISGGKVRPLKREKGHFKQIHLTAFQTNPIKNISNKSNLKLCKKINSNKQQFHQISIDFPILFRLEFQKTI